MPSRCTRLRLPTYYRHPAVAPTRRRRRARRGSSSSADILSIHEQNYVPNISSVAEETAAARPQIFNNINSSSIVVRLLQRRRRAYSTLPIAFYDSSDTDEETTPQIRRLRSRQASLLSMIDSDDRPRRLASFSSFSSTDEETPPPQILYNGCSKEAISKNLGTTVCEKSAAAEEVCAVCLELYREKQKIGVLGCRHRFHEKCIEEWLQVNNVCPLCKAIGISEIDRQD